MNAIGNKFLDSLVGYLDNAQKSMDDMLTDANKGGEGVLLPNDPKFGLTYSAHKFVRDGMASFISGAQKGDKDLVDGINNKL